MACGYAKLTGRLGVCLATSGPGGIHLLNGLYDAKLDGVAVLAITGLQYHDLVHTHTQQDVELDKLFMDVCVYNARVMGPAHVENVMQLACRTAASRGGVAHVTMPVDMQSLPLKSDARSARNVRDHASMVGGRDIATPSDAQLRQAAAILAEGRKICILAGRGALHASAELAKISERLAAPVAKALLGKGALADLTPPLHRRGRPARDRPVRAGAEVVRYTAHRRQQLSLHRTLSQAWQRPRGADRQGQRPDRASLSRRMRPGGRCRADVAGVARAAAAE